MCKATIKSGGEQQIHKDHRIVRLSGILIRKNLKQNVKQESSVRMYAFQSRPLPRAAQARMSGPEYRAGLEGEDRIPREKGSTTLG